MKTQFILRMALILLAIKYTNAEAENLRRDLKIEFNYSNFKTQNGSNREVYEVLEGIGVRVDEDSEIFMHQEDNYVDLTCFNCIIINMPKNYMGASSYNEDLPTR